MLFATRDNVVRWLTGESRRGAARRRSRVAPRRRAADRHVPPASPAAPLDEPSGAPSCVFAPAGILAGLSYVCLYEAYDRGRVSVVSPLVATESLWGVALSALVIGRKELVGGASSPAPCSSSPAAR